MSIWASHSLVSGFRWINGPFLTANDITKLVAHRGRIVIIGCRGTAEINPRGMMGKSSSVIGMALNNTTQEEMKEVFSAIDAGLSNGTLCPVISSFSFPLDQAPEAHRHIIERPSGTIGKVVLFPSK